MTKYYTNTELKRAEYQNKKAEKCQLFFWQFFEYSSMEQNTSNKQLFIPKLNLGINYRFKR